MKLKHLMLMLPVLLASFQMFAQIEMPAKKHRNIYLNAHLLVGVPTGEWSKNLDLPSIGIGSSLMFQVGKKPAFLLGGELGWQHFDNESAMADAPSPFQNRHLTTQTGVMTAHAIGRFKPQTNFWLQPYADVALGTKMLYSTSLVMDSESDSHLTSSFNDTDFALSYGGALGLQLNLFNSNQVLLDFRCTYLGGSNASYLTRSTQNPVTSSIDAFEKRTSKTGMLMFQTGLTFNLSKK